MFEQFRRDFFPVTERQTLQFDIVRDDWETIRQLLTENEWELDDGLRHLLAIGVVYVQGRLEIAALNHPGANLAAEVRRLQRERMAVESRYAVMKYRAFTAVQAVQAMEMKLNACKQETESLHIANQRLRDKLNEV